jgi:hypothetical protein
MEDHEPFFLQSRAVVAWMQGRPWNELVPADFVTILPIKHFNDLEKPIKASMEDYPYIYQKTLELVSMWVDCHNHGYKPSDFREGNRIYSEDLRAFQMLDTMHADAEKRKEATAQGERENRAHIEQEQARFKRAKGRR